ncbi:TetR/AcrR family transcriptional regulator [Agromyces sp. MMS24-JH15]|uniref:TetR/AcrR family transcriptional regulator n=1 Tax=Agromyces sp. MMS24-JH15 TaxID=3243765 RepID=UPI0037484950
MTTTTDPVAGPSRATGKRERTSARLLECGLDLFERDGYEATTVASIARAAGVTEMTFFRHFPSKEALLLEDPYDPLLADAIGARPADEPAFVRAVRGLREAWRDVPEPDQPAIRRRIRVAAGTPSLRGAMWRSTGNTERAMVDRLVADGADPADAAVAVAAVLAALVSAMFAWAADESIGLAAAVERALDVLDPDGGRR